MMNRIAVLVKGEFVRLNRYNLFAANFVVLLLWVLIAYFIEGELLRQFIPVIFIMETTMMTIILVGVTLFYEKKEHTVHSILVSPVTADEYLLAKIIAGMLNAMITVVMLSAALYFIKGVTYRYELIVPAVAVTVAMHTVLGLWMSYESKNFTSMLTTYMLYILACLVPPVLVMLGIVPATWKDWMILLPPEAAGIAIGAALETQEAWKLVVSYGYLLALAAAGYLGIIRPRLVSSLMRELGV